MSARMHKLASYSFLHSLRESRPQEASSPTGKIPPIAQRQNPATMKLVWPYDDIDETWTIASS